MSNAVFPTFPGLMFDVTRTPVWSTTTVKAVSLRAYRTANASFPIYRFKLSYEFLRQTGALNEMAALAGFFNARQGGFDSFLFADPDDNTATNQAIGTGDGVATQFQAVRTFGGYLEPVYDFSAAPTVYINGTTKTPGTDYVISAGGLIYFTVAPAAGALVTYTGSYYRRVVFAQDSAEFGKFMQNLWTLKTIELEGVKP